MKVKDYIKHLQSLDQEREIWVRYELFATMELPPPYVVTEKEIKTDHDGEIKLGDYLIDVW